MSRYVVVAPLVPMAAGDRFKTRDWPLHVTIVQVFTSDAAAVQVARHLEAVAADGSPLTVAAGADEGFGPSHTIPVTVIEPTAELDALHAACVEGFAALAPVYENPEYMGQGFRPHVTIKRAQRVSAGDVVELRQLALVDMDPDQPGGGRRVLAVADLAG